LEERLARLEHAVAELRTENMQLREQLRLLGAKPEAGVPSEAASDALPAPRRARARWSVVALVASLILMPFLALTGLHMNAFQSTAVTALNAILLYVVGPAAWRLMIEGLVRAIPAVLFGQATRIAIEKWRKGGRAS
jgi:hypothetical protein